MAVTRGDLTDPEQGMDLATRAQKAAKRPAPAAGGDLEALRERIDLAKTATPNDPIPHCGDCYRRGWKAAVRAIEG